MIQLSGYPAAYPDFAIALAVLPLVPNAKTRL